MSLIYKSSIINFTKNKKKVIFRNLNKSINGEECLLILEKIIFFLSKKNIKNIVIASKNSICWPLWYIAADGLCEKIYIINPEVQKKSLLKIIKQNNIDYVLENPEIVFNFSLKKDHLLHVLKKIDPKLRSDILFTSGTTDLPKGVVINESAFNHVAKILIKKFKHSESDNELLSMPFYHSFGLTRLRSVLLSNSSAIIVDGLKKFPEIYTLSKEIKITGLSLVPSGILVIKNLLRKKISEFSKNIKYFEIGSSSIDKETRIWLKHNFQETIILHHYGMTEASRSFLRERGIRDDFSAPDNWIGEPIDGCSFKLNHEKNNKNIGELMLKGSNLFTNYLELKLNEKRKSGNWFKTGDVCSIENGIVKILGRNDNQFNIGGYKVQAELIESKIEELMQVKYCLCF